MGFRFGFLHFWHGRFTRSSIIWEIDNITDDIEMLPVPDDVEDDESVINLSWKVVDLSTGARSSLISEEEEEEEEE